MSKSPDGPTLEYLKTIEFYEKIVADDPNNFEAWNRLAIANMLANQRKLAIECWKRALELKPKEPDVLNNLGTAFLEDGVVHEALALYRKAVAIAPEYIKAWQNLGEALLGQEKYEEAIEAFQEGLRSEPSRVDLKLLLAQAYYSLSRWQDVLDILQNALEINNENDIAWYNKACVHARLGQVEDACKSLGKAIVFSGHWKRKARNDSDFDEVRSEDCIQRILEE
ncbi:MAG: tetratricopeptide repeat protein [Candidatus Heimdallarchaeota archaeon]